MRRPTILDRIRALDPERDHESIVFLSTCYDFRFDTTRALEFALFRTFVFKRPISIVEIYDEPGLVDEEEFLDGDTGPVNESAALARGRSTSGPVPPGALSPEGD